MSGVRPAGGRDRVVILMTIGFVVVSLGLLTLSQFLPESADTLGVRDTLANPPAEKARGVVSVWVKPGVDPKAVLMRYGVNEASIRMLDTDKAMGEVPAPTLERTVRRLQGDPEVKDAGFLTVQGDDDITVPALGRKAQ